MIDINKITEEEMNKFKATLRPSTAKSDFDRYYLFTTDLKEKRKVYLLCYRFLENMQNLFDEGELMESIRNEIVINNSIKNELERLWHRYENNDFNNHRVLVKIRDILDSKEINNLIDFFSIATETVNIIDPGRFKGVVMEGNSKEEFNKAFKNQEVRRI